MKKNILYVSLAIFISLVFFTVTSYACQKACTCQRFSSGSIFYEAAAPPPPKIDIQTGEGYCIPPTNLCGLSLDVTKCSNKDKLIPGNKYRIGLKLWSDGFEFLDPATSATPVSYSVKMFASEEDLNNGINGIELSVVFTYAHGPDTQQLISNIDTDLVQAGYSYYLVEVPPFTYDKSEVDPTKHALLSVGVLDGNSICPDCGSVICCNIKDVGKLSCTESFKTIFPYALCGQMDWWTGVAIANLSDVVGTCTVEIVTPTNTYSFQKIVVGGGVYTFTIDELMSNENYKGSCWIKVIGNFPMDGICFFGNNNGFSSYIGRRY